MKIEDEERNQDWHKTYRKDLFGGSHIRTPSVVVPRLHTHFVTDPLKVVNRLRLGFLAGCDPKEGRPNSTVSSPSSVWCCPLK